MSQEADVGRFCSWLRGHERRKDGVGEVARYVRACPRRTAWDSFADLRIDARASGECTDTAVDGALIEWHTSRRERDGAW